MTAITEATHLKITIGVLISGVLTLCGFIWQASAIAKDVVDTKEKATKTDTTVAQLAVTSALQAQTLQLQQQQIQLQQQQIKEAEKERREVHDVLIRIEAQGNRR